MTGPEQLAVFGAGMAAGTINTIVGSGTLVTFPVLLAVGFPPVTANVSNTVGLVLGQVSAVYGYRRELRGQRDRIRRLGAASLLGGLTGGVLLLVLPAAAFRAIVPALIGLACILVVAQPTIARRLRERPREAAPHGGPLVLAGVYAVGVYGGYFGAAQGIMLLAILGLALAEDMQRINGIKNVLAGLVNFVAAALFIVVADVAWHPAVLIAGGAFLGGHIGARIGRRLPPAALRAIIVVIGVVAIVRLLG